MILWKDEVLNRKRAKEMAYDARDRIPMDLIDAGIVKKDLKMAIEISQRSRLILPIWRGMTRLSVVIDRPLLLNEGFYDYLCSFKKHGGRFSLQRASTLRNNWDECNRMDLGFKDSPFTYRQKHNGVLFTYVPLDRALCNTS